jgi:hypothetical protein
MAQIVNVAEVDKNKRKDADVGAELEFEMQQAKEVGEKLAAAQAEATAELNKWLDEDLRQEFKIAETIGLHDVPDPTAIPRYVYKRDGTRVQVWDPERESPRWVRAIGRHPRVSWRRTQGYRPKFWSDLDGAITDWERFGAEGYILNGDCILMTIDRRRKEALDALIEKRKQMVSQDAEARWAEQAARAGVPAFRERGSKKEFL